LLGIYFGPSDVVAGVAFLIIFLGRFRIDFNGGGDEAAQVFLSDRRAEILLEYIRSHSSLLQSRAIPFSARPRREYLPQTCLDFVVASAEVELVGFVQNQLLAYETIEHLRAV